MNDISTIIVFIYIGMYYIGFKKEILNERTILDNQ